MPRVTTDSGKTLDDVLQAEADRQKELFPLTRRGDSIVPSTEDAFRYGFTLDADGMRPAPMPKPNVGPWTRFILERPASHATDPHTSKTAAASVVQTASRHRELILSALKEIGPSTGHELAQHLGLEYVQVAKRLTELAADGRINRREILAGRFDQQAGAIPPIYQTRPSPSGRPACVWHLNPLAP